MKPTHCTQTTVVANQTFVCVRPSHEDSHHHFRSAAEAEAIRQKESRT